MPYVKAKDSVRLYFEESGTGTPVVFVHEYAADYRAWEPQMRRLSRSHRCVTYSQRGYPPSDIPDDPDKYLQDAFRDDVVTIMDALKIDQAHIVGHSMGAMTALHVGITYPKRCISVTAAGCGYGSSPDRKVVEESRASSRETGKMFAAEPIEISATRYASGPTRQAQKNKDPRGYAEFVKNLTEHSALGHSLTMINLQGKRL
jgi:pimeloyl-ACP methyl ester carboxylesterase